MTLLITEWIYSGTINYFTAQSVCQSQGTTLAYSPHCRRAILQGNAVGLQTVTLNNELWKKGPETAQSYTLQTHDTSNTIPLIFPSLHADVRETNAEIADRTFRPMLKHTKTKRESYIMTPVANKPAGTNDS